MMNVEIAERLARKRKDHGYSQEELAEKLGVSRQAVSKWERSESSPDTDNLIALAQLYEVSIDDLLYEENAVKQSSKPSISTQDGGTSDQTATSDGAGYDIPEAPPAPGASDEQDRESEADRPDTGADVSGKRGEKVHLGPDGVHVVDGEDYVHVSWRDGVHVKNDKDGEVHVGWNGIHIHDPKKDDGSAKKEHGWSGSGSEGTTAQIHEGVVINGEYFESWKDARRSWRRSRREWERHDGSTAWARFPYPVLAVLVFLLAGLFWDAWHPAWVVFLTIPLYYAIGTAVSSRRLAPFLLGLYPTFCIGWFVYMAIVMNQAHPAWLIFLTIPLVEWLIVSVSHWWKRRKESKQVIDVEGESTKR